MRKIFVNEVKDLGKAIVRVFVATNRGRLAKCRFVSTTQSESDHSSEHNLVQMFVRVRVFLQMYALASQTMRPVRTAAK